MARSRESLLISLAKARRVKASKDAAKKAIRKTPVRIETAPVQTEVITSQKRELAKACTETAMLMGWERAIQKTAYENSVSEQEMKKILDEALEYEDKADPAGRIDGLQDWRNEKRGASNLASPRKR